MERLLELANISFEKSEKVFGKCQYIFEDGDSIVPGGNLEKKLVEKYPLFQKEIGDFFSDMDEAADTFGKIYEAGYSVKNLNFSEMKSYFELSNLTKLLMF